MSSKPSTSTTSHRPHRSASKTPAKKQVSIKGNSSSKTEKKASPIIKKKVSGIQSKSKPKPKPPIPSPELTKVHFSKDLLKNKYERKLLTGIVDKNDRSCCNTCAKEISFQYRKGHLLSNTHWQKTPDTEKEDMLILARLYEPEWVPPSHGTDNTDDESAEGEERKTSSRFIKNLSQGNKAVYLEFIGFLIAERYSFDQIVRLGIFLQDKYLKTNKLEFLKYFSWDAETIRMLITDCIAKDLKENLMNDLKSSPFSISLDCATVMGDQVLAIRAKYLKTHYSEDLRSQLLTLENHILCIEELKESSTGKVFYNILDEKIFKSEQLKNNWIGMAHDGASNLCGEELGLVGQLNKNLKKNF